MIYSAAVGLLLGLLLFSACSSHSQLDSETNPKPEIKPVSLLSPQIPERARQFERPLISNARFIWGLNAPIAVFAGQIQQESAWNPDARSPYANGLAQFTPSTAEWISSKYSDLSLNSPFEPQWALRALTRYDKFLFDRLSASDECNQWGFTLSAYNGGEGNVNKDQKLAASKGLSSARWFGSVEKYSNRGPSAFKENRDYPRKILLKHQLVYLSWGPGVECNI